MAVAVRYRVFDGVPMVGVTHVLTVAGRISDRGFSEVTRQRGLRVHELTELYDADPDHARWLVQQDADRPYAGYVTAYGRLLDEVRPVYGVPAEVATLTGEYAASERYVRSAVYRLIGRIDRICQCFYAGPATVDLKTGSPAPWHGEQLAGYNRLCPIGARWAVYLQPTGRYQTKLYTDPGDDRRFLADLATVHAMIARQRAQETTLP